MQEWTRWFREKTDAYGTLEDFARESGLSSRMVSYYRAGGIPRKPIQEKIARVLGSAGPIPGKPKERLASLEERLARVERIVLSRSSDREVLELEAELDSLEDEDQRPPESATG